MATILTPFVQWCYHAMNFHKEVVNNPRNEALFPGYFSPIVFHSAVQLWKHMKNYKMFNVNFKNFVRPFLSQIDNTFLADNLGL